MGECGSGVKNDGGQTRRARVVRWVSDLLAHIDKKGGHGKAEIIITPDRIDAKGGVHERFQ